SVGGGRRPLGPHGARRTRCRPGYRVDRAALQAASRPGRGRVARVCVRADQAGRIRADRSRPAGPDQRGRICAADARQADTALVTLAPAGGTRTASGTAAASGTGTPSGTGAASGTGTARTVLRRNALRRGDGDRRAAARPDLLERPARPSLPARLVHPP